MNQWSDFCDDGLLALHESYLGVAPFRRSRLRPLAQRPVLLFVHGLAASPAELDPLPEQLAQAQGWQLLTLRLTGHGLDGQALAQASCQDWLRDIDQALKAAHHLNQDVWLLASSTAVPLCLTALAKRPTQIKAMIALSANMGTRNPFWPLLTWPLAKHWLPWLYGKESGQALTDPMSAWTSPYPVWVLHHMAQAVRLGWRYGPLFRQPCLWIGHAHDPRVNSQQAARFWLRLPSNRKEWCWLAPPSDGHGHILAGEKMNPDLHHRVLHRILAFMQLEH